MAWSDPGDFTSGQILTAAQMDSVREAMFFGQATFTDEAARDAAFGGPLAPIALQEGMRAYLTAPTVPAATGATTSVPTGITTVYNGSVWVCTTPVGAFTSATGTSTSGTFSPTLGGTPGTNPSVTLVTGTTALVSLSCVQEAGGAIPNNMAVAVSGAGVVAAAQDKSLATVQASAVAHGRTVILSGLTAGTNTFTLQYRRDLGTTSFSWREVIVQGIA